MRVGMFVAKKKDRKSETQEIHISGLFDFSALLPENLGIAASADRPGAPRRRAAADAVGVLLFKLGGKNPTFFR